MTHVATVQAISAKSGRIHDRNCDEAMTCHSEPPCVVHAVIVAYRPRMAELQALLHALRPQVARLIVVDNTPRTDACWHDFDDVSVEPSLHCVRLGENVGIARALNIGIAAARQAGATHVLLSDQDSVPAPDMVRCQCAALRELTSQGYRVGAVGATFMERNTGLMLPFQVEVAGNLFYGHKLPDADHPWVEVLTLITSGVIIPVAVLNVVGCMREDLFIDNVDIEWSHRARAHGFALFGVYGARMMHTMGDRALRVWYFGWRRESAYPAERIYYRVRNFIVLCRLRYVSWPWKVRHAWTIAGVVYAHVVFGRQRAAAARAALRGVVDGILGRMRRWS